MLLVKVCRSPVPLSLEVILVFVFAAMVPHNLLHALLQTDRVAIDVFRLYDGDEVKGVLPEHKSQNDLHKPQSSQSSWRTYFPGEVDIAQFAREKLDASLQTAVVVVLLHVPIQDKPEYVLHDRQSNEGDQHAELGASDVFWVGQEEEAQRADSHGDEIFASELRKHGQQHLNDEAEVGDA